MRLSFFLLFCVIFTLVGVACGGSSSNTPTSGIPTSGHTISQGSGKTPASPVSGKWLTAKEAVGLAYAALSAEWKPDAKLAFVGRYSRFCNVGCSPFDVEKDPGIGSDGRQAHWIVIFVNEATTAGDLFYVEEGKARLVASHIVMRPDELFDLEGWVDSTEIQFRTSRPVGLELRTSDLFDDVDAELGRYSLLWLAETSFARFDVYDAVTGQYIKSR